MSGAPRPLCAADAPVLAALHAEAMAPAKGAEVWDAPAFASLLAMPGCFGYLAGDAEPEGFILCRAAADEAEVLALAVGPRFRRRGVASALFEAARRAAAAGGARRLFLEVAVDNEGARQFYAACGFKEVGRRRDYYCPGGDALILGTAL